MVTVRSGLVGLARGLRSYFASVNCSAAVLVGWNARARQDNSGAGGANRVVLVPGVFDPSAGAPKVLKAGRIDRDGPMNFYADPTLRMVPVAWWHEGVTCSVWAVDPTAPTEEERQIEATESLLELTVQGLKNSVDPVTGMAAGFADLETFGDVAWTLPPAEMSYGRELTFGFELFVPLYDAAIGLVYPQAAVARSPAA
jgi:hypothetical protein